MTSLFIDIFIVLGFMLAAFLGYRGGFTKKIFDLLVLIGSIILGVVLMDPLGTLFEDIGLSPPWCFLVAIAFVIIGLTVAAYFFHKKFGGHQVAKSASQFFGVLLGLFEGGMIISICLIALRVAEVPSEETRSGSVLYKPVFNMAPKTFETLRSYLPGAGDFQDELNDKFKDLHLGNLPDTIKKP